jgi:hypothetical protein
MNRCEARSMTVTDLARFWTSRQSALYASVYFEPKGISRKAWP